MIKSFENYTRLTGNHGRRGSLWKGEDHLLAVEGRGIIFPYSEHYRRVDYKNIQAISYVLTKRYWLILFAFLIPILGLAGGAAIAVSAENIPIAITLGAIMLPFIAMLILHMVMGRTCICTLQTAVQSMRLIPLTRLKKSLPVLHEIEALCLLHQGGMPKEISDAEVSVDTAVHIPGGKPFWQGSRWVIAAGVTLVLWGAVMAGELFVNEMWFLVLDMLLGASAFICSIVSLTKAVRHRTPEGLMPTLWGSLVIEVIGGLTLYILMIVAQILETIAKKGGANSFDTNSMYSRLAALSFEQTKAGGWIIVGLGGALVILGLILISFGFRRGPMNTKPSSHPSVPPAL